MVTENTRVFVGDDKVVQHFAEPPGDEVAKLWTGSTRCGLTGELTWVHPELVDVGETCVACIAVTGTPSPALEGDDPGPV